MGELFTHLLFNPLYNGLIFFIEIVPFADVGLAVIALTLLVKLALFPISIQAVKTQRAVREIEKPLKEIREKFKGNPEEQAKRTMALYKEKNVNPFSSILLLFIQIPIIIALYWVFYKGGLPAVNVDILYAFVPEPETVNMKFIGLIDMAGRSIPLAVLAGLSQFAYAQLSIPKAAPLSGTPSFKDDLARSFNIQMRYILPVTIGVVAYFISSAVALYWVTSNIVSVAQEFYVRRTYPKNGASPLKP